jgi:extracellular factor (EF) 3-hydroxypalmitic acid methyl ester biosynthesis protein
VLTEEQLVQHQDHLFALLGPSGAFLPDRVLPMQLPPPFRRHTDAAAGLAEHLPAGKGGVRPWLDAEFGRADASAEAVGDLDELQRHKLLSTLVALAHAYRWHTVPPHPQRFEEWRIALPPGIAEPLHAVAAILEHPRVGTTWSLHSCNWWMPDRPGGGAYSAVELSRDNLRLAFPWLGPPHDADLEAFSLTFVLTEAKGARVLGALRLALRAATIGDAHATGFALDQAAGAIAEMTEPFIHLIREPTVSRRAWLPLIQPTFAWAAETAPGEEAGLATPGPSGMQTGVIQALDAALGVGAASFAARSSRDGRRFMLGRHRRFLEGLDELRPVLRGFVERSRDPHLIQLFNECVRALRTFRVIHVKRGAGYLREGRRHSGPRVSTGLAARWTDDAHASAQTTVVEAGADPVATFERTMAERIEETSAAALAVPGSWDGPSPLGLAPADMARILARAVRRQVAPGAEVIHPDERRQALYVIRSGSVRIAPPGQGLPAGRLGPGELFGEVAFLLNHGAPAGVVAEEELEVDVVVREALYQVLDADGALAARFYKALAVLEAERLRLVVRRAGDARPADVPTPPDPRLGPARAPPAATRDAVAALLTAARSRSAAEVVGECDRLVDHLAELGPEEAAAAGQHVLQDAFPVLGRSRLLKLAMLGPGRTHRDARALTHAASGRAAGEDVLGEAVDAWAQALPTFAALRERGAALRRAVGADTGGATAVTGVESVLSAQALEGWPPASTLTHIDSDPEVLDRLVAAVPHRVRAVRENVVHLAHGLGRIPMEPQDVVYCLDLLGYLKDREAVRVLDWVHGRLRPGGVLLLASPRAGARDTAFLEHVAGWALCRRPTDQLGHLFSRSNFLAAPVTSWTDRAGGTTYSSVRRQD